MNRYDLFRLIAIVLLLALFMFGGEAARIALSITFVSILILLALPFFPGVVDALATEPNRFRPKVDTTGQDMTPVKREMEEANVGSYPSFNAAFFTFLEPGQIKAIIRGKRFIRFIMRFEGFTFSGEQKYGESRGTGATPYFPGNRREDWDVIETPDGAEDAHPIPHSIRNGFFDITWWWSRLLYRTTGAVFTGIPPYQTVLVYELEQLRKVTEEGAFVFFRKKNFSDHVRAAEFQFFIQVPNAETQDQVQLLLQYALTMRVVNPYRVLYDTDLRWASRLSTAAIQEITTVVKGIGFKDVIAKSNDDGVVHDRLIECVRSLDVDSTDGREARHGLRRIGLAVHEVELLNADVKDPKFALALADVAKAKADKEARILRGEGEAQAIEDIAKAAKKHGALGQLALQVEGNVRTVRETKDGQVILNVGSSSQPIDPATALLRQTIQESGGV